MNQAIKLLQNMNVWDKLKGNQGKVDKIFHEYFTYGRMSGEMLLGCIILKQHR